MVILDGDSGECWRVGTTGPVSLGYVAALMKVSQHHLSRCLASGLPEGGAVTEFMRRIGALDG